MLNVIPIRELIKICLSDTQHLLRLPSSCSLQHQLEETNTDPGALGCRAVCQGVYPSVCLDSPVPLDKRGAMLKIIFLKLINEASLECLLSAGHCESQVTHYFVFPNNY